MRSNQLQKSLNSRNEKLIEREKTAGLKLKAALVCGGLGSNVDCVSATANPIVGVFLALYAQFLPS